MKQTFPGWPCNWEYEEIKKKIPRNQRKRSENMPSSTCRKVKHIVREETSRDDAPTTAWLWPFVYSNCVFWELIKKPVPAQLQWPCCSICFQFGYLVYSSARNGSLNAVTHSYSLTAELLACVGRRLNCIAISFQIVFCNISKENRTFN